MTPAHAAHDLGPLEPAVLALAEALRARGWRLVTAESCTGGLIAAACTAVAGSSDWFERGIVSYSNLAKTELLGVPDALIALHGAVSREVAEAMAAGALARASADLAVAVTGIAGPGGATPGKPVGLVWLALADAAGVRSWRLQFDGDRATVRGRTVLAALDAARLAAACERVDADASSRAGAPASAGEATVKAADGPPASSGSDVGATGGTPADDGRARDATGGAPG